MPVLTKMKVLLIMFAPHKAFQMQIGALSAFLKKCGYKVRYLEIIVYTGDTFDKYKQIVKEEIQEFQPDLVGFSSYDMNYYFILDCANFIKSLYPNMKIIVGGHNASLTPEDYMKFESIDYVCIGEGEYVLKDLLESLSQEKSVKSIKGLCSRDDKGKILFNNARGLIENLDELPFMDRTVDKSLDSSGQLYTDHLPMLVGRGCPFSCTYCSNESIKKLYPNNNCYVRYMSPEKVIEEIEECKKGYKFPYIIFYDDIFASDYNWLQKFCELYIKHFTNLPFHSLLRPELATSEKNLDLLYKAGCRNIKIGVESGSQKYRQEMLNRKMTNKTILKAASLVRKYNMKLHIFMMVGLPGETFLDMVKSLWLNLRIGADSVQTAIYYPFKNTPLYKYCVDHKLINGQRRKKLVVYTFDTCLDYGFIKRLLIILLKWLNSGTPIIRRFRLSFIILFLRIQHRKWFKKEIDYKNR